MGQQLATRHLTPKEVYAIVSHVSRHTFVIFLVTQLGQTSPGWGDDVWVRHTVKGAEKKAKREVDRYRHRYGGLAADRQVH